MKIKSRRVNTNGTRWTCCVREASTLRAGGGCQYPRGGIARAEYLPTNRIAGRGARHRRELSSNVLCPPPPKASELSRTTRIVSQVPLLPCSYSYIAGNRTDEAVSLLAGSLAVIRLTGRGCSSCTPPRGWVRMVPGVLELGRQGEQHVNSSVYKHIPGGRVRCTLY